MIKVRKFTGARAKLKFTLTVWLLNINVMAMNKDSIPCYRVISVKECIEYLEKNGLTIFDESDYEIKSRSGLIYLLSNKEVVLIPTNLNPDYPGMVFRNFETFTHYAEQNFFPIGRDNMTWYERYNREIKEFRANHDFYWNILNEVGKINLPLIKLSIDFA